MLGRAVNELDREGPYVIVLLTYCGVCGVLRFAFAHSLAHSLESLRLSSSKDMYHCLFEF